MPGTKTIKCSQCNRLFANRAALQQHVRDAHSASRKQPSGGGAPYSTSTARTSNSLSGGITISRTEALSDITTDGNGNARDAVKLQPTSSNFTWLHKMYEAFSEAEYLSFAIFWKPAVSANTDGRIAFCFDADGKFDAPSSRTEVLSHSPSMDAQVWKDTQQTTLRIPNVLLRSRPRWPTSGSEFPGTIMYFATGPKSKTIGELWVSYSVRFYGPR